MSAEELARLKDQIEKHQVEVDAAYGRLDDFLRKSGRQAPQDTSNKSASQARGDRLVPYEKLMEAMTRLNAAYKEYVRLLERKIGF